MVTNLEVDMSDPGPWSCEDWKILDTALLYEVVMVGGTQGRAQGGRGHTFVLLQPCAALCSSRSSRDSPLTTSQAG